MVLDQVSERSRAVVVAGASLDPDVLGRDDLNVVDEVAIPDRLEQRVGEPQRHQVLDRFLTEVVIDPEDLGFVEHLQQLGVELPGGGEVIPERLLDHDPCLCAVAVLKPGLTQLAHDQRVELRARWPCRRRG